ncbi:MAG: hypothetical protein HY332_16120 [Chloroflexi bacterium]|nr:hypothetical protein [Chloroflexota bacterium]
MTAKETLHRLVDELPDEKAPAAEQLLEGLRDGEVDPMLVASLTAPLDDEPTTPDEDAGASEAREQYRGGDFVSAEHAKRLLLS